MASKRTTYHWRQYLEVHKDKASAVPIEGQKFRIVLGEGQPVARPKSEDDFYGINDPKSGGDDGNV